MNVWIHISAGQGPVECCEAVYRFATFLKSTFMEKGVIFNDLAVEPGPSPNILSSILISAKQVDLSELKKYEGTIRWIAQSTHRPTHKRKNWYISMKILPEQEPSEYIYDLKDVSFKSMRAGGPGGQHQNKTESAIRLLHIPTNIEIIAREERSQHQNKKLALAKLSSFLDRREKQKDAMFEQECWEKNHMVVRGNAVATFRGQGFKLLC